MIKMSTSAVKLLWQKRKKKKTQTTFSNVSQFSTFHAMYCINENVGITFTFKFKDDKHLNIQIKYIWELFYPPNGLYFCLSIPDAALADSRTRVVSWDSFMQVSVSIWARYTTTHTHTQIYIVTDTPYS